MSLERASGSPPPESFATEQQEELLGRMYIASKRYFFPSDEAEHDRLDLVHQFLKSVFNNKLHTPRSVTSQGSRVLDLGCGTGIFAMQVADSELDYDKGGRIVGVDLTLTQPYRIPASCVFVRQDIEQEWAGEMVSTGPYDTIFCRLMRGAIHDWQTLFHRIFAHLVPGEGIFEHVELDWRFQKAGDETIVGPGLKRWADELHNLIGVQKRMPIRVEPDEVRQQLMRAGFVDIQVETHHIPIGAWGNSAHEQEVGRWFNLTLDQSLVPMSLLAWCRAHNAGVDEFEDWVSEALANLRSTRFTDGVYCCLYVFTARRP